MSIQLFFLLLAIVLSIITIAIKDKNKDISKALCIITITVCLAGIIVSVLL